MMLLIVISLAVLPSLLTDVLSTLRKRNGKLFVPCILLKPAYECITYSIIRLGRLRLRGLEAVYFISWIF